MAQKKHHMFMSIIIIMSITVFVFYCCYNKLPQNWWLKTAQICYLTVLEFKRSH